jgi:two-component system, OmpR family, sensor kinase
MAERAMGSGASRRRSRSLMSRAVVATCLVALVSVLITAVVALPLTLQRGNAEARRVLAEKASVAADLIEGRTAIAANRTDQRAQRVAAQLRAQGIQTFLIRDGLADQAGLPSAVIRDVSRGNSVSRVVLFQGGRAYVEGRPAGNRDGIVLVQRAITVFAPAVLSRLWLALAAGLFAGVLAGALLARRLARPIRSVADAARRLSAGDRRVRAPVEAPAEVADLSHALNHLAAALAASENRQRAFLMSISHELRTPLTTIKGYAEAIADGVVEPDGVRRVGQTMLTEAEQLDRLVADLLVLARLEADDFPLEMLPVELVSLVSTAAEAWSGRCADMGVALRTELPGAAVPVVTDPVRLRQIIDGLLENAMRVVPPGAPVVLAVRPGGIGAAGSPDEPTLAFPVAGGPAYLPGIGPVSARHPSLGSSSSAPHPPGGGFPAGSGRPWAVVEVRDGGPGFSDDDLAVVFERGALYERYKGVRKVGSGLGLALASRLAARLGGSIAAGHAAEGGARFVVRLPAA